MSVIKIITTNNFTFDILYRKYMLGLGVDIGSNKFIKSKPKNFFIEITVLFFTFGFEYTQTPSKES